MTQYRVIEIIEPTTGFKARLSVGYIYKGWEVVSISSVEIPDDDLIELGIKEIVELTSLSREAARQVFIRKLGTYSVEFRKGTIRLELGNNQQWAPVMTCRNLSNGKIALIPQDLRRLSIETNKAAFSEPLP